MCLCVWNLFSMCAALCVESMRYLLWKGCSHEYSFQLDFFFLVILSLFPVDEEKLDERAKMSVAAKRSLFRVCVCVCLFVLVCSKVCTHFCSTTQTSSCVHTITNAFFFFNINIVKYIRLVCFMSSGKTPPPPFRFFMWKFCCATGAGEKCGLCSFEGPKYCFSTQTEKRSGPLPYPAHHIRRSGHCCYVRWQTWAHTLPFMSFHLSLSHARPFTEITV